MILSCSGNGAEGLTSFDAAKLTAIVDTMQKAIKPEYPWTRKGKKKFFEDSALVQASRRWSISNKMIYSAAIIIISYRRGICGAGKSAGDVRRLCAEPEQRPERVGQCAPSEPVIDGLSISAAGRIFVPLKNGTIVTFFGGTVSVQHPQYARPEQTPVPAVSASDGEGPLRSRTGNCSTPCTAP